MNKTASLLIFCLFSHLLCIAQPGTWTWMSGSNTPNSAGNFGIMGVAAPTNQPPALYEACEWTDLQGRFWLYGGFGSAGAYSALWMYDPASGLWAWMSGSNVIGQLPSYGLKGVPAATNSPGARSHGVTSWVDNVGNLWLFGGARVSTSSSSNLGDLWKYDISINMWTWISGSNVANSLGAYGTMGIPSINNYPAARSETSCSWTDNSGSLWLFGGIESNLIPLNDLWKYNISTNEWTWMRGSNISGSTGNYGLQGMSSPNNDPPARYTYSKWVDKAGDLWLFGGTGLGGNFNDLWKYEIATNQWTWVKGSNLPNPSVAVAIPCQSNVNDNPSGRYEGRVCWTDTCDNFWLFGGITSGHITSNDLWQYNVQNNLWTLINTNSNGNYGSINIPATTNKPPERAGALPFTPKNGTLWLYGGMSLSIPSFFYYNDLWRYVIDTSCAGGCVKSSPLSIITTSSNIPCNNQCSGTATATPTGTAPYIYSWNTTPVQTTQTATGLCAGSYTVTVTDVTSATATAVVTIIQPVALTTSISSTTPTQCTSATGSATVAAAGGTPNYTYNWLPTGGTTATASNLAAGTYTVTTTDANGCTQTATATIIQQSTLTSSATSTASSCAINDGTATVTPVNGTPSYTYNWSPTGGTGATTTGLAPGTYTVTVTDANGCTNTSTVIVASTPGPTAAVSANVTIASGNSTVLNASGGGTYNWYPSIGLSCVNCNNPTATPTQTTTYCVEVTDNNGCKDTACVKVTVEIPCLNNVNELTVPNAFSPNGDNVNDDFCLQGWNYCVDEFVVYIYDRWGEKVFESTNPDFCWDGTYNNKIMESQVFVYYAEAKFSNQDKTLIRKGNISLIK